MTMLDQKIYKYLRGTATSKEEKEVQEWIVSSDQNAKRFLEIKAKYVASTLDETDVDLDASFAVLSMPKKQAPETDVALHLLF